MYYSCLSEGIVVVVVVVEENMMIITGDGASKMCVGVLLFVEDESR